MFCPHCGAQVVEGVRFCRECGADLTVAGAPPIAGVPETVSRADTSIEVDHRDGPAWERREGALDLGALWATIVGVLLRPTETFSTMKRTGGLETPLLFALIPGAFASIVSTLVQAGFQPRLAEALGAMGSEVPEWLKSNLVTPGPLAEGLSLIGGVLMLVLGLFVVAGLVHVCLLVVGGAKHGFETTFRTVCYTKGSFAVLQVIPSALSIPFVSAGAGGLMGVGLLGLLVLLWTSVVQVIALARAHDSSIVRAGLAVSLPAIVCCGTAGGIAALVAGVAGKMGGM